MLHTPYSCIPNILCDLQNILHLRFLFTFKKQKVVIIINYLFHERFNNLFGFCPSNQPNPALENVTKEAELTSS